MVELLYWGFDLRLDTSAGSCPDPLSAGAVDTIYLQEAAAGYTQAEAGFKQFGFLKIILDGKMQERARRLHFIAKSSATQHRSAAPPHHQATIRDRVL